MSNQDLHDILVILDRILDAMETSATQTANEAFYSANRMVASMQADVYNRLKKEPPECPTS
jgi:hypothetical protein